MKHWDIDDFRLIQIGTAIWIQARLQFFFCIFHMDRAIPHLHRGSSDPEGPHAALSRTAMLVLAVTLHNIPEGMAVGMKKSRAFFWGALSGAVEPLASLLTVWAAHRIIPALPFDFC